ARLRDSLVLEIGKTKEDAEGEIGRCIQILEHCCSITTLQTGETLPDIAQDMNILTFRLPLGVTAGITPFNFPAMVPISVGVFLFFLTDFWADNNRVTLDLTHFWSDNNKVTPDLTHFWADNNRVTLVLTHFWADNNRVTPDLTHFWADNNRVTPDLTHFWADYNRVTPDLTHFWADYNRVTLDLTVLGVKKTGENWDRRILWPQRCPLWLCLLCGE
ncbi:methylmalonate-semialdehyde dehydrogenase [acylating], mitochondrial, partial [Biomphalaria glabrata]